MWVRDVEPSSSPAKGEKSTLEDIENVAQNQITTNKENVFYRDSERLERIQNKKLGDATARDHRRNMRATFSPEQRNLAKKMLKNIMLESVVSKSPNSAGVKESATQENVLS